MAVRRHKGEVRPGGLRERSSARRILSAALPFALVAGFADIPLDAHADNTITFSTPRLTGLDGPFSKGILGLGAAPTATTPSSNSPGAPCLEILQGNGTGAGYVLTHGNILPQTVSIHAGGDMLLPNRDYWLDPLNGTLFFARPMPHTDRISVSYRYIEGQDAQRQPMGVPTLQFGMGHSAMVGLFYGMTPGNGSGFDISTYGLALNSHFDAGSLSDYKGLAYFSHSQRNTNLVANLSPSGQTAKAPPKTDPGSDHLIVQDLNVRSGAWQAHADYQDVGKQFAGFSALKLSYAGNKSMLDQLTQLEGEKGVKRLGFGFAYQPVSSDGGGVPGGLSFDWSQIRDGKGAITQQAVGYRSSAFHVDYSTLDVGQTFAQFSGLRESDHDQWAKEKGIHSQELGLGFNFALGGRSKLSGAPQIGGLDFVSQRFADKDGGLQRTVWSLDAGRFHFLDVSRHGDAAFNRLGDLADKDKTALALDLYRQYDPRASAEQVAAADKAQVARETGFSRNALAAEMALGKTGSLAFSDLRVEDTSKKGVDDAGFQRESFLLDTPSLDLTYVRRQTGAGFSRLGDLADIEKSNLALDILHQFDPSATLSQVTQKERDQAATEAG